LQGILNYFVYRHSFKVSSNDTRPSQGGLPRVRHKMYGALEDCLREGETKLTRHSIQKFGDSTSSGQDETTNSLLNSGRTVNPSKEPKNKYAARLLGE
jgi:hypothetical protein